jgi:chromosome segregation ATPase
LRGPSDKETPTPEEFGTGLRTHLERTRVGEQEPEPAPEAPDPEAAELAAEEEALEERRRELAERREQIAAVETTLRVREQRITEVRAKLADEERRLSAAEAELTTQGKAKEKRPSDRRRVRQLLRERAEREAERVWGAFEQGLIAAHPDGSPDLEARIATARALLAEAYGPPGGAADAADESPDELAPLRKRKRGAST